nr:MAG TPA: hypothetical protein [Caudoviricetes sp.]
MHRKKNYRHLFNFVIFTSHNLDITPIFFIPTSELDLNYIAYTFLFYSCESVKDKSWRGLLV